MVIHLGMLALGRYMWLCHQRKQQPAAKKTKSRGETLDITAEEGAPKTPREKAAWEAYRYAAAVADALADLTTDNQGRKRRRTNDFRDIRRILQNTPPAYWIGLLQQMIQRLREFKAAGADDLAYHTLVLDAMLLGLLISTGCRIEELSLIRLDVQFDRQARVVRLRAIDRKNRKPHTVLLQEIYLPDDLLNEYLDRSRPWFIAGKPTLRRPPRRAAKSKRSQPKAHPFLLVSTRGTPFACLNEKRDGTGRNAKEMKARAHIHGKRFEREMVKMANMFKMEVPGTKYEFGPHTVRGSCGYGVRLQLGLQAAAHYLGDEEDTVRQYYSAVDGCHVDSSCLVGFQVTQNGAAQTPAAVGGWDNDERTVALREEAASLRDELAAATARVEELLAKIERLTQQASKGSEDVADRLRRVEAALLRMGPRPSAEARIGEIDPLRDQV